MLSIEQLSIQENQFHCVDNPRSIVIVVSEGSPLASLLCEVLSQELAPGYARQLFANVSIEHPEQGPQPSVQFHEPEWIEPLTNREREVLQHVAAGFSRREIAARLAISGNTVKTHLRNIYIKLGVNSQMQAVGKARALGLLEKDPEFITPLSILAKTPFNVLPSGMAQPAI